MAPLLVVRFPLPSLLGRLIIMQVRFLYFFGWLRAVFCGTMEVLCSTSCLLLQNTFTMCHRSFLVHVHVRITNSFTNYILHFSICLHARCSCDPLVLYKTKCLGLCFQPSQVRSMCKVLLWFGFAGKPLGFRFHFP